MILAVIFVVLGFVAMFPILIIAINSFEGGLMLRLNVLLEKYEAVFLSVGTLFIVSGLAVLSAKISGRSIATVEIENRKHRVEMAKVNLKSAKEMKIAEFRQIWINDMRRDVAEYISVTAGDMVAKKFDDKDRLERMSVLSSQIFLRLNPNEKLSEDLGNKIREIAKARRSKDIEALNTLLRDFASISREILKGEWKRLKDDLDEAIKAAGETE
ncbi:hypothetical protein [Leisingera daeponensis]|uniref:hypothetical protein n=1 Tax=Leisingera daeponensis TaxID=405746 RepID=UPI001C9717F3|nr:hypothetical protein [Leisingera daeponensis]MBY6056000.1 hypothetical protein [Leisingera daeponensis]